MVLEGDIGAIGIEVFLSTYTVCIVIVFIVHMFYFYDENDFYLTIQRILNEIYSLHLFIYKIIFI